MEHNKDKVHTSQTQGGYVYIDVLEEAKEEKQKGKCITIGIETEENDIEIGIIRAENDIKEEESMYRPHSSKVNISQVWVGRVASTRSLGSLEMALHLYDSVRSSLRTSFPSHSTHSPLHASAGMRDLWQGLD